jgi:hypothetical protein
VPTAQTSAVTVDGPERLQLDTVSTLRDQSSGPLVWLEIAHFTPALPLIGGVKPSAGSMPYLGLDPAVQPPPFLGA